MRETAVKVLGITSHQKKRDKKTWWWNEKVQESVKNKRLAKKKWDTQKDEESRQEYKTMRSKVKVKAAKAKEDAYNELY